MRKPMPAHLTRDPKVQQDLQYAVRAPGITNALTAFSSCLTAFKKNRTHSEIVANGNAAYPGADFNACHVSCHTSFQAKHPSKYHSCYENARLLPTMPYHSTSHVQIRLTISAVNCLGKNIWPNKLFQLCCFFRGKVEAYLWPEGFCYVIPRSKGCLMGSSVGSLFAFLLARVLV